MAPMKPMAMSMLGPAKRDLNDVTYDAFLANDRTLADPEIIKVEPGGRALLRVINGSSMSAFHVDLGQLDGELIAVDGIRIAPVTGRRFPIAVAQRLDIQLSLPREPAHTPCWHSSKASAARPESFSRRAAPTSHEFPTRQRWRLHR
jgi:Putative multicopper oxidases